MIKRRLIPIYIKIRWGCVCFAGALFLIGLFVNVNSYRAFAYTSLSPQDERIHLYRPVLLKPVQAFSNPHPSFKPKTNITAVRPAASAGSSAVECQNCHSFYSVLMDSHLSSIQIQGYESVFNECTGCHLRPKILVDLQEPV